ncbi:TolC family protein [Dyadobacter sp.]|uniref:TolC family protein n=1 Tax=Dyadobacter sp. TaxID=1914288 RepID=UPI003F72552B
MIRHKLCLPGILIMLVSSSLHAQSSLGLTKIWEITLSNYPSISSKQAQLDESRLNETLTRSNAYMPNVQLQLQNSMGTYASSSGAFFPLPGVININGQVAGQPGQPSAAFNTFGSVVADWKFFEFGRKNLSIKAADLDIDQATNELSAEQLRLKTRSAQLFLKLLNSKVNLQWALQNEARTRQIFELSASLAVAGLKPGADSSLALSAYLQTDAEQESWRAKLSSDLQALTELAPDIDTAQGLHYQAYLSPAPIMQGGAIEASHPYLQVLDAAVRYGQTQAELAGRQALPSFSALGGVALRGSGIGQDGVVENGVLDGYANGSTNYLLGLALTWNITNASTSNLAKKRILSRVRSRQANYEVQKLDLNTRQSSTSKRIEGQLRQISSINAAVKNARLAYELYLSRFENGLISLTELLQIQLILQQAEKTNIDAHSQLWEQVLVRSEASGDFSYLQNQFK